MEDWSDAFPNLFELDGGCEFEDLSLTLEALFQDEAASEREQVSSGSAGLIEAGKPIIVGNECTSGSVSSKVFLKDVLDWSDALPTLFELNDAREFEDFGSALEALFREPRLGQRAPTKAPRQQGFRSRKTTDVVDWAISMEELFETPLLRRSARLKAKPLIDYAGM